MWSHQTGFCMWVHRNAVQFWPTAKWSDVNRVRCDPHQCYRWTFAKCIAFFPLVSFVVVYFSRFLPFISSCLMASGVGIVGHFLTLWCNSHFEARRASGLTASERDTKKIKAQLKDSNCKIF